MTFFIVLTRACCAEIMIVRCSLAEEKKLLGLCRKTQEEVTLKFGYEGNCVGFDFAHWAIEAI